jgi:hypothetical protein
MRIRIAVPDEHVSAEVIDPVLEAVTRLNESMIRSGQTPTASELVKLGAVWRPENMGDEHFDHGATIASRGWGDCDDWAPLRAAEMRASGEDPGAVARVVPSGPSTYHAIVQRSDGTDLRGPEDISVQAGMRGHAAVSGDGMEVWACDPHDGRIYQGSLAPTVGPLTMHCGPGLAVRGCHVVGGHALYEARVDMPISGSPLVHVRSYNRHRARRVHGALPYAISVTHLAGSPRSALSGALCGAVLCGDAAETQSGIDRYKLLALQGAMAGLSPGDVRERLKDQIHRDMLEQAQASGAHPEAHVAALLAQTSTAPLVVGGFFDSIAHIASSVVSDVSKVASTVLNAAPWGDIIHGVQAAVSVIPGLGTAVSDVIAAAETAYESAAALLHGNPLEAAIHAAYNFATATIPGAGALRIILDPVVNTLIGLTVKKEPIESALLDGLLTKVPDAPKLGSLSPRSVAASLAHLIVDKLGIKKTPGHVPQSKPAAHAPPVHVAPKAKPKPAPVKLPANFMRGGMPGLHVPMPAPAPKLPGVAHAAIPVHPTIPPHPTAAPAPSLAFASAPAAAKTTWHCAPLPGGHWACAWQ